MTHLFINTLNSNPLSLKKWYFLCAQNIINKILCSALNLYKVYFYRFPCVIKNTVPNFRRYPLQIL